MSTTAATTGLDTQVPVSTGGAAAFEDSLRRAFGLDGLPCDNPETPDNLVTLVHCSDAAKGDSGIFMPDRDLRTDENPRKE